MAVNETFSSAIATPELQYRRADRIQAGMGMVNEGFHMSSAHKGLFLRSTSSEAESAKQYLTSYAAYFQLQELLVPFEAALLTPQSGPVTILFDNPLIVEKVLYYTQNGKQLHRDLRYEAALLGVESGKKVFLQNLSLTDTSHLPWSRQMMENHSGKKSDSQEEYSGIIPTKLEGVVFEYQYPAGETRPARSIIINPL